MAQYSIPNGLSIDKVGLILNCDRPITINPTGTIVIYDNNNNVMATVLGNAPEISTGEG